MGKVFLRKIIGSKIPYHMNRNALNNHKNNSQQEPHPNNIPSNIKELTLPGAAHQLT